MSVDVQEIECMEGRLGLISLNAPETLNALDEDTLTEFQGTLDRWADDDGICLVVLQGRGDRGFCAGGHLRDLHDSLTHAAGDQAIRQFALEYRLVYSLHRFPKPVVGMAHGITMGAGLGLLSACRYRLAMPDVTLAMPEISVGLFPDVGASWFLNRLPGRIGLFMGLTGARLNITDAIRIGLIDIAMQPDDREPLLGQLQDQRWTGEAAADDNRLFRMLNQMPATDYRSLPRSHLEQHEKDIARLSAGDELPAVVDQLLSAEIDSPWWSDCMRSLREGCPVSAWLVWTQLQKAQQMSLKDILRMELGMAAECARRGDLAEGIRARLIDRQGAPAWSYSTVAEVPADVIDAHFQRALVNGQDPMPLD
ncbi:enoyl-CoA hydratase/isomerase family protein [Marinobacter salinisoli]|uniref:3-hydroxyisobutyryl-CoA hydrolase n=1 Tax=Marinobacter salinisoli TaxID=2769486 RepID=A0ABX7MW41_9GAMM|nr:enoyl-CoA hydratase/isomerase family protein [Marinobacter salinisoli]QSP95321.1 enoyl-CoA hydratase/isomerase family protein [Marinobacter salinisoli]